MKEQPAPAPACFWMVYVPAGHQGPQKQHPTREAAQQEARRVAQKTGQPAYVLLAEYRVAPIQQFDEVALVEVSA